MSPTAGPLLALGLPLLASGAPKAAYDPTLWRIFRRVRPPSSDRSEMTS